MIKIGHRNIGPVKAKIGLALPLTDAAAHSIRRKEIAQMILHIGSVKVATKLIGSTGATLINHDNVAFLADLIENAGEKFCVICRRLSRPAARMKSGSG